MKEMMEGRHQTGIDRPTAQMLCRLFHHMYRLGVNDCAQAEDEGLAKEWIRKTSEPGVFGRLGDETSHDALYWQLILQKEAHSLGIARRLMDYMRKAGRYGKNYLSVAWVMAQCFYNSGMEAWCRDPHAWELPLFNTRTRARWDKARRIWSNSGLVSQAQEFCFQRQHSDMESEDKKALKAHHYLIFIKSIGLASKVNRDIIN